jgi:transcriptional/translational regulatory protein YebC/TACO1
MKDLHAVRGQIADAGFEITDAELQYVANNDVVVDDSETARKVMKVLDALEDLDDVTNVHTNADIQADVSS